MNDLNMPLFGDRSFILRSFILQPSLTDYKETGKRTFTTTVNVEDRIKDALNVADISSKIGLNSIVDRDISLVKLENQCEAAVEIDGGISAPRYLFTMIIDVLQLSGNITRITLKGYTSAFELNRNNFGNVSRAIPQNALFYIDSYSSVIYAKSMNNRYVATNSVANEHVLSTDGEVGKTMLRPCDIALANHIGSVGSIHTSNSTNVLNNRKNELSSVADVSSAMFTKKILDGVMTSYHETFNDLGFGGSMQDSIDTQGAYFNMAGTTLSQVPVFLKFFDALKRNKVSVFSLQELEYMLGTHNLDGMIQVIDHTDADEAMCKVGYSDVNNLGSDTITVGSHDFFNNLQSTISFTGFIDVSFKVIVNCLNPVDKYDLIISNFHSVYDTAENTQLQTRVNALRHMLLTQCVEAYDKFLRYDEEVNRIGHYIVTVNYRGYVDCVIQLEIGEEVITFRYPTFASSRLTPLVSDQPMSNKFGGMVGTFGDVSRNIIEKNVLGGVVTENHQIARPLPNNLNVGNTYYQDDGYDSGIIEEAVY